MSTVTRYIHINIKPVQYFELVQITASPRGEINDYSLSKRSYSFLQEVFPKRSDSFSSKIRTVSKMTKVVSINQLHVPSLARSPPQPDDDNNNNNNNHNNNNIDKNDPSST